MKRVITDITQKVTDLQAFNLELQDGLEVKGCETTLPLTSGRLAAPDRGQTKMLGRSFTMGVNMLKNV